MKSNNYEYGYLYNGGSIYFEARRTQSGTYELLTFWDGKPTTWEPTNKNFDTYNFVKEIK